jgi:hypothetical protein
MGRTRNANGEKVNSCRILVGKPQEKKLLWEYLCMPIEEYNIKMHLTEIGCSIYALE